MLHSEAVIAKADGTFVTVRMQAGDVTAISATSITVRSTDGYSSTYAITDATVVEHHGEDGAPEVGDSVHIRGTVSGVTVTAELIHTLSPQSAGGPGRS